MLASPELFRHGFRNQIGAVDVYETSVKVRDLDAENIAKSKAYGRAAVSVPHLDDAFIDKIAYFPNSETKMLCVDITLEPVVCLLVEILRHTNEANIVKLSEPGIVPVLAVEQCSHILNRPAIDGFEPTSG